jgi:flagellar biosynthesis/type III secretory pathway chaperone
MYDVWWKLGRVMMTKNGEMIQRDFEELQSLLELYKSKK